MADQEHTPVVESGEVTDRGLFDFMGKKKEEEKSEEEVLVAGVEKVKIEEGGEEEPEKKHTLRDQFNRTGSSSSSSSSDEEEGEEGKKEKKKKKRGLKEKIEEKLHHGDEPAEELKADQFVTHDALAVPMPHEVQDTAVVVEKVETTETVEAVVAPEEEKKGFLEKIKDKLPGHNKKTAEEGGAEVTSLPPPVVVEEAETEGEKKSFMEKIKEKISGSHKSRGEEGDKTSA